MLTMLNIFLFDKKNILKKTMFLTLLMGVFFFAKNNNVSIDLSPHKVNSIDTEAKNFLTSIKK